MNFARAASRFGSTIKFVSSPAGSFELLDSAYLHSVLSTVVKLMSGIRTFDNGFYSASAEMQCQCSIYAPSLLLCFKSKSDTSNPSNPSTKVLRYLHLSH